jgi:hypothetical protein
MPGSGRRSITSSVRASKTTTTPSLRAVAQAWRPSGVTPMPSVPSPVATVRGGSPPVRGTTLTVPEPMFAT